MLVRLQDIGADDRFDVCVIGSGPAGIVCALQLAKAGRRVLLLEGGGRHYSEQSQNHYRGKVIGDSYPPLDVTRLRYFGGTSGHWGGWCRELDKVDFGPKAGLDITQWPIKRSDIDPYLAQTCKILEIDPIPPDKPISDLLKVIHFNYSPPVRFGTAYYDTVKNAPKIFLALNANFTSFQVDATKVTGAEVRNFAGFKTVVRADKYILATGGIENSRLLLWSNRKTNGQTVKHAATLGHYWMDHPTFTTGEALLPNGLPFPVDKFGRAFIGPTPEFMRSHGTLNCGLRLRIVKSHDAAKRQIEDIACVAPGFAEWAARQLGKDTYCGAQFLAAWEQEPRTENRVTLGKELDAFGMPRPILYWKKSALDHKTVEVTSRALGEYLARKNIGRLKLLPWVLGEADYPTDDERVGPHHMGGTRMSSSPATGIVDANCKVFGQENLYIAGSSVFPSCGHANPTLTIVQLALRLCDHLTSTRT